MLDEKKNKLFLNFFSRQLAGVQSTRAPQAHLFNITSLFCKPIETLKSFRAIQAYFLKCMAKFFGQIKYCTSFEIVI